MYKWNSCTKIVDSNTCESAPIAWFTMYGVTCVVIGLPGTEKSELLDPSNPSLGIALSYSGYQPCLKSEGTLSVRLETYCSVENDEYTIFSLTPYNDTQCMSIIKAKSKYACINSGSSALIGGLSVGSIICITFAATLVVYFAVGIFVNVKYKQKTGIDIIPQREYWKHIFELSWDGTKWTYNKIRGRIAQASEKTSLISPGSQQ